SWTSLFTISGEDKDQNGIRADVQNWIIDNASNINTKRALAEYAFVSQNLLGLVFDRRGFRKMYVRKKESEECISFLSAEGTYNYHTKPLRLSFELKSKIHNTPQRMFWKWLGESHLDMELVSIKLI